MTGTPATQLTVISGGINRLRTKGGADKNSLYDLLNGYVTQANTVKVRPGTTRYTNLAPTTGVSGTVGLVGYQGNLHVFSSSPVPVPAGYVLHVLNYPAFLTQTIALTCTRAQFASPTRIGGAPAYGNCDGTYGFANKAIISGGSADIGSISPISLLNATNVNGFFETIAGHSDALTAYLITSGFAFPATGVTVSYTAAGGAQTVALGTANLTTNLVLPTGYVAYNLGASGTYGPVQSAGNTTLTFSANDAGSFPIKEIHFAAPFLGGLYVVAEFSVPSALASHFGTIFHYWIQSSTTSSNSNVWTANTDYQIGSVVIPTVPNGFTYVAQRRYAASPLWTANTQEQVNNVVEPNIANGFNYTCISTAGASPATGAVEPTWPTQDGATINENSTLVVNQVVNLVTGQSKYKGVVAPRYQNIAGGFK